mmetsp:Transcript_44584/g.112812  ORF Transcript_44584/g.112812 Transcript_44584/m.112812 type:complete len:285 (-) Transcript_44584:440-1294(-)
MWSCAWDTSTRRRVGWLTVERRRCDLSATRTAPAARCASAAIACSRPAWPATWWRRPPTRRTSSRPPPRAISPSCATWTRSLRTPSSGCCWTARPPCLACLRRCSCASATTCGRTRARRPPPRACCGRSCLCRTSRRRGASASSSARRCTQSGSTSAQPACLAARRPPSCTSASLLRSRSASRCLRRSATAAWCGCWTRWRGTRTTGCSTSPSSTPAASPRCWRCAVAAWAASTRLPTAARTRASPRPRSSAPPSSRSPWHSARSCARTTSAAACTSAGRATTS